MSPMKNEVVEADVRLSEMRQTLAEVRQREQVLTRAVELAEGLREQALAVHLPSGSSGGAGGSLPAPPPEAGEGVSDEQRTCSQPEDGPARESSHEPKLQSPVTRQSHPITSP